MKSESVDIKENKKKALQTFLIKNASKWEQEESECETFVLKEKDYLIKLKRHTDSAGYLKWKLEINSMKINLLSQETLKTIALFVRGSIIIKKSSEETDLVDSLLNSINQNNENKN